MPSLRVLGLWALVFGVGCVEPRDTSLFPATDAGDSPAADAAAKKVDAANADARVNVDGPLADAPATSPEIDGASLPPPVDAPSREPLVVDLPVDLPVDKEPPKPRGASCTQSSDCASDVCSFNKICCERACEGLATCDDSGFCSEFDQRQDNWSGGNSTLLEVTQAQTFTVGVSGRLTEVRFRLWCERTAELKVELREVANGRPDGRVLTARTVTGDQLKFMDGYAIFLFDPPPPVTAGQKIAVTFRAERADAKLSSYGGFEMVDAYPRGSRFVLKPTGWEAQVDDSNFQTLIAR